MMRRREFLTAPAGMLAASQAQSAPYNLLYILADQHSGLATKGNGDPVVQAPTLERLAGQGIEFTNACSAGMTCGPSRASLNTGLHHQTHGVRAGSPLPEEIPSLQKSLLQHGYTLSERFHGDGNPLQSHLEWLKHLGYENVETNYVGSSDLARVLPLPLKWKIGVAGLAPEHSFDGFIAERAISFLERNRNQRFACFVQFRGPHDPYLTPRPYANLFDPRALPKPHFREGEFESKPPRQKASWQSQGAHRLSDEQIQAVRAIYYGMVAHTDHHAGRVLRRLEDLGLADNTVVVYLSDHGDTMGHHRIFSKDYAFYEPTVRTPLLFRTPDPAMKRGTKSAAPASGVDVLPTLLELLHLPTIEKIHGRSLVPAWRGSEIDRERQIFCGQGFEGYNRTVMLRQGQWKLTRYDEGGWELYDREADPHETYNRVGEAKYAAVQNRLQAQLRQWDGDLPHRRPIYTGRETDEQKLLIEAAFNRWETGSR
jgi:arylsulfatase A-like enzyme